MKLRYFPILKAKSGEFSALIHTTSKVAASMRPLFEVAPLSPGKIEGTKYLRESEAPTCAYLDRVIAGIIDAWGSRPLSIDTYFWPPDAQTETGSHVASYIIANIEASGGTVVPVVGYIWWEDDVYREAMKAVFSGRNGEACLRLDFPALADATDPTFFLERVSAILAECAIEPVNCDLLLDFGDVTNQPIPALLTMAGKVIDLIAQFGFRRIISAGCSVPKSVDLAVSSKDTSDSIVRRELLLWKSLRKDYPTHQVVYGDYAIRGPNSNDEIRSKYINGKIRYTIKQNCFVMRGHPFKEDGGAHTQMYSLAEKVYQSGNFLGAQFSWGDERINECRLGLYLGGNKDWVAIDTNHHIAFVYQEVEEFELSTASTVA